jgi:hypothetical protein
MSLLLADTVAKVENRTTLKISRKLIFRLLCCCVAIRRRYQGPWSILDKSIWSLTSPRSIRISSSKKLRSSPQKEFFNTIRLIADRSGKALDFDQEVGELAETDGHHPDISFGSGYAAVSRAKIKGW